MTFTNAIFEVENGSYCSYISRDAFTIEQVRNILNNCYEYLQFVQISKNIYTVSPSQLQAYVEELL